MTDTRFDPAAADARWQAAWDDRADLPRRQQFRQAQELRARDVSLSLGAHPHRPCAQLHDGRRAGALQEGDRARGAAPDGLGRVRHAGGKRGDGKGRASGRLDPRQYRAHEGAVEAPRLRAGLEPRAGDLRAGLLRPRAGAVHRSVRSGPRLSQGIRGQLGPGRHDRARQRTGDRRQGLALGRGSREAQAQPVVPQDHGLCRGTARRVGKPRKLARQGPADAGKLDRQVQGAGVQLRPVQWR